MEETRVPIYLITGFLESGKTSFLNFTLQQVYFQIDGKTLLYSLAKREKRSTMQRALKQHNTDVEIIERKKILHRRDFGSNGDPVSAGSSDY